MERKNCWKEYSEKRLEKLEDYAKEYMHFLNHAKTERECCDTVVNMVEKEGFEDLAKLIKEQKKLKEGDKVYATWMNKAVILMQIGKKPMEQGMNMIVSHIDSPRLDVKPDPLYEKEGVAYLDTHYYGGIKKYQWVTTPLAMHGVVVLKNGKTVNVVIGEDKDDPVLGVTDLLIHLAGEQMEKKAGKVIEGESLDILIGSIPEKEASKGKKSGKDEEAKASVKTAMLRIFKEKYGIEEEDFFSAELEVVPAGPARDYGIDRSMIMGYGHDDRVCAYTSLIAMLEVKNVDVTSVCLLVDKEEIGSVGATGMHSKFFENMVAEIMNCMGDYSDIKLRRALSNSKMLSSDVSAAYDPLYPSAFEKKNAALLGYGMVFNKFTGSRGKSGSNDCNAEYLGELRSIMEKQGVNFQSAELGKVDVGGGGTIAYILAQYGMEVVDSGIPVLSMHAPWEIVSKIDVYETMLGYKAFIS